MNVLQSDFHAVERHLKPSLEMATSSWHIVKRHLRDRVSDTAYHIWLEPLRPVAILDNTLLIGAPPPIFSWCRQRFDHLVSDTVRKVLGGHLSSEIVEDVCSSHESASTTRTAVKHPPSGNHDSNSNPRITLNPKYSFDQFVIGESNRFAHAAALTVAESPSQAYNPLFIHSPSGLGKTHLLQSIADFLSTYSPELRVLYVTTESFTNEFISSLRSGNLSMFKDRYRLADVLLVDDIQFLEGKTQTQEEAFHTLNTLHELGSQLVISSDRPPNQLNRLHKRLQTRLDNGLSVGIDSPDRSTRIAILRKRASLDGIGINDGSLIKYIANSFTDSIRSLEGALIRTVAFSSLKQQQPSTDIAQSILERYAPPTAHSQPTVESIKIAVSNAFDVSPSDLNSPRRTSDITLPRHVAMYLTRKMTSLSLPKIAEEFNRKDHTTVLNASEKISKLLSTDDKVKSSVDTVMSKLTSSSPQRILSGSYEQKTS